MYTQVGRAALMVNCAEIETAYQHYINVTVEVKAPIVLLIGY